MSTPMPSPSMNGMIGSLGVGCPGSILAPPAGTSMSDFSVIRGLLARFSLGKCQLKAIRHRLEVGFANYVGCGGGADYAPRTDGRPRPDASGRDSSRHRRRDDRRLRSPLPAL